VTAQISTTKMQDDYKNHQSFIIGDDRVSSKIEGNLYFLDSPTFLSIRNEISSKMQYLCVYESSMHLAP